MFAIGDKVVRVRKDATVIRVPTQVLNSAPPLGRVLVVDGVWADPHWPVGEVALIFNDYPTGMQCPGWHYSQYEKLVPADPAFCEMIRKCKPRVKEEA